MDLRSTGFVLLIWFPGVVLAQSATQSCQAPRLDGGYFPSDDETYSNNFELFYACNNGRKPVGKGWWATSKCINGAWVPKPQCIDENNCFAPKIPNAEQLQPQSDWYNAEKSVRIKCDKGYKPKPRFNTVCRDGNWTSLVTCEKSDSACSAPSEIPHAVIINQEYREVFDEDSEVQYECEDGYTVEGGSTKSIWCTAGNWTVGPSCNKAKQTDVGQGGSSGGHTPSVGHETQPSSGDRRPGTGHSGAGVRETDGGHTPSVERETQPGGRDRETRPVTGQGGGTTGTIRHPVSGGSSATSDRPMTTLVDYCGEAPVIANGVIVHSERMFLKYQCNAFYTRVGPDTVMCYGDGTWSQLPTCKEAFCVVDPNLHAGHNIKLSAPEYVKENEGQYIQCTWEAYFTYVQCINGRLTFTRCCHIYDIERRVC